MIRSFVCAAVLAGIGSGAWAAELDGCDLGVGDFEPIVAPLLDGAWIVHNGPGIMMMKMGAQQMKMPLPPMGSETMAMLYRDGAVYADMRSFGEALVRVSEAEDEMALVPVGEDQRDMDFDQLGTAPNCTSDVMLRLQFDGEHTDSDGAHLWTHFHLAVVDEDHLSGVMVMQGRGADGAESHARRLMTFVRLN